MNCPLQERYSHVSKPKRSKVRQSSPLWIREAYACWNPRRCEISVFRRSAAGRKAAMRQFAPRPSPNRPDAAGFVLLSRPASIVCPAKLAFGWVKSHHLAWLGSRLRRLHELGSAELLPRRRPTAVGSLCQFGPAILPNAPWPMASDQAGPRKRLGISFPARWCLHHLRGWCVTRSAERATAMTSRRCCPLPPPQSTAPTAPAATPVGVQF